MPDHMSRKTRNVRRAILVSIALLFVSIACSPERVDDSQGDGELMRTDRTSIPPRPGEHWVQGERLRDVMSRISRHASRWPAVLPGDPESPAAESARADADDAFRDAIGLADGMAEAAKLIPRSVADHPMSAEDRRGFGAEADRLRRQALELRRAARARQVETMQRTFTQISSTCASCHSQYKDYAGELEEVTARP